MKTVVVSFFFAALMVSANAQTNPYQQDLWALKSALEKTFSFREQIKGDKADAYQALYIQLLRDSGHSVRSLAYFYNLCQLIFPLKDNHLGFYQLANLASFRNQDALDSFASSPGFHEHPQVSLHIDSLKSILRSKPTDSIEGIYHYDKYYTVGLYRDLDGALTGIVIDTQVPHWAKGQIVIKLYPYGQGMYKAIYAHPITRSFIMDNNEKFRNGSLINSKFYASFAETVYTKQVSSFDHANLPASGPRFRFRQVGTDIDYLLVRSFQNNATTKAEAELLYTQIKDSLKSPNLILDLRNNEGGSQGMGEKLYQLIRTYSKKGRVWILINNGTLSQAELQIIRMMKLPNVKTLGEPSKGMLTYGSNYGKRIRLPSGKFEFYPTDMRGSAEHLRFEDIGIQPDIILDNKRDWLEQVEEMVLIKA